MSLEAKIEALTAAVQELTALMRGPASVPQPAASVQPPVAAPVMAPAPAMPAPPTFQMPAAPAPAPAGAPFTTAQGLMEYAMGAYKAMGPEKGARIQGVLQGLGVANLNDLQPAQYGQFYAGVEALKAS